MISSPSVTKGSSRAKAYLLDLLPAEPDLEVRSSTFPTSVPLTRLQTRTEPVGRSAPTYATTPTISSQFTDNVVGSDRAQSQVIEPFQLLKFLPRSKCREREKAQAKLEIHHMPLNEGGLRCGTEPSGVFPPLQSVAGGPAALPKRFSVRSTSIFHLD